MRTSSAVDVPASHAATTLDWLHPPAVASACQECMSFEFAAIGTSCSTWERYLVG